MHESSLGRGLLTQVLDIAHRERAQAVVSIKIRIGPLSGIEPSQFVDAFAHIAHGTLAQDARVVIDTDPLRVRCLRCGAESDPGQGQLECRQCGSPETQLLSGAEVTLTDLELLA